MWKHYLDMPPLFHLALICMIIGAIFLSKMMITMATIMFVGCYLEQLIEHNHEVLMDKLEDEQP